MKQCSKCKEVKPLDGFHAHKKSRDGKSGICKTCACSITLQWVQDNKERKKAADRKYHQENPPTLEKRRELYLKNRETKLAYEKRYRQENPEKRRAIVAKSASKPDCKIRKREAELQNRIVHPEKYATSYKVQNKRSAEILSDGYVASLLTSHTEQRQTHLIPPQMIEAKRAQIKLHRLLKELKK